MAGTSSARVIGSGTTESVPTYDPVIDSVVEPVEVIVPVTVASPVAPAKNPVPPVKIKSIVTFEIPQFALQLRLIAQFKGVHVVAGRDCFDLAETCILVPLGKHQVPAEIAPSGHDRGE
jgi:hypothetical protein